MLSAAEQAATVASIAAVQLPSGMIPWFPGGHADPWNHVEAAMALTAGGLVTEAERAYEWLAATQRPDGAWHQYYRSDGSVEVALLDANVTAYVATGVLHHARATGDAGFVEAMGPVVERAMGFVVDLQGPGGEVTWARHADGTPWPFALLTSSASIGQSLRAAAQLAGGHEVWTVAAQRVEAAVAAQRPGTFLPKDRWSMDWYYPVLTGAVTGDAARRRLDAGWDRFVLPGLGVRCVADRAWVTAGETFETAMACVAAGRLGDAERLLKWGQHLRAADGSYYTGTVHPHGGTFPAAERTTYSAAAAVLAANAVVPATMKG